MGYLGNIKLKKLGNIKHKKTGAVAVTGFKKLNFPPRQPEKCGTPIFGQILLHNFFKCQLIFVTKAEFNGLGKSFKMPY